MFQEISSILKELRRVQRQLEGESFGPFRNYLNGNNFKIDFLVADD